VQFIVALITAGTVGWFLSIHWFPSVRKAIRQLPDTGIIRAGQLVTPRGSTAPLVETRYLSIAVDAADTGVASSLADLRVEFHRTNFAVCGFAGCMRRAYAADATMQFNRSELESWWGAWQPMLFGITALVVVAGLFASWLVLATLYFPIAWVIAYFKDRRLTARSAWKLAAAALLPGALLVCGGIIIYGLGIADLLRLLVLWLAHFAVGWVYLIMSPFRLPPVTAKPKANPFGRAKPASPNPFKFQRLKKPKAGATESACLAAAAASAASRSNLTLPHAPSADSLSSLRGRRMQLGQIQLAVTQTAKAIRLLSPGGRTENSPPFQGWDYGIGASSPEGTAELLPQEWR
jgi:hypothetical protein